MKNKTLTMNINTVNKNQVFYQKPEDHIIYQYMAKEDQSFMIPSLVAQQEYEEYKDSNVLTEKTFRVENAMLFDEDYKKKPSRVQKQLNFNNIEATKIEDKLVQIQRYLFGTDLWFTGLGMNIHELCDPKDKIIKEGELYRYKPGIDRVYISRWCQLTTKVFRVYKNQMAAKGFKNKPIIAIPLYVIENVKKSKFKAPKSSKKTNEGKTLGQNQFEFMYKDQILDEIMMEFLESKGMINNNNEENYGDISERKADKNSDLREKLEILKSNLCSDQPFKIDSKTPSLNNSSSWSNREGEWFLSEKRLLFSTKRAQDLNEWTQ